jgi:DNA repair exonuclease SbcCD ATPase subunit
MTVRHVLLRNWRGYEKLSLDFGPGLTFVIADNGVGKTSLVNGVAWAIFGEASGVDADAAIRAGAEETSAEVDLVVGDATFTLSRSLRRTASPGRSRESFGVEVDGEPVDSAELRRQLHDVARAPLDVVPSLMFVPEMRLTHEGELFADVHEHLAGLLGIDTLRTAARNLRQLQTAATRDLRTAREVERIDDAALAAARERLADIGPEIEALDRQIAADAARRRAVEATLRQLDEWQRYDGRLSRHQARLEELAAEARTAGLDPDPDALVEAAERIGRESTELQADVVAARTETSLVEGFVEQLDEATDAVCPVCLQDVDTEIAQHATEQHRARLAELAEREAAAERRRQTVEAVADRLDAIASELARQHPPEPPSSPRPDQTEADLLAEQAELDSAIAESVGRRGALGERLTQAEAAIAEAERSRTASAEVAKQHALVAASGSLAQLAASAADARTEAALEPISRAIGDRWAEFFVGSTTRPRLAGGGTIELGRGGATIPYASFSGGEKTLASLLTRLLFVTSTTGLTSMWLDEPLEHLDPGNRTRVARLLAQVVQPGNHMRQMVVTTYEEGLARSMVGRHDATGIVYVSTDDVL